MSCKELRDIAAAIRGIDPLADIAELEQAQIDIQALIVALQAEDSSLQSQISGNDTDISGHASLISALQAADTSLQAQISGNDTDISGHASLISALQAADTSLQAQISGNDTDISGHNSRISALEALGGGGGIEGYAYAYLAISGPGGSATSGAWRQRPLNGISSNLPGVALSGYSIVGLSAGMYIMAFNSPMSRVRHHQAKSVIGPDTYLGCSAYAAATYNGNSSSALHRVVELAAPGNATLYYKCEDTYPAAGLGTDTGFGLNIFGYLSLIKVG